MLPVGYNVHGLLAVVERGSWPIRLALSMAIHIVASDFVTCSQVGGDGWIPLEVLILEFIGDMTIFNGAWWWSSLHCCVGDHHLVIIYYLLNLQLMLTRPGIASHIARYPSTARYSQSYCQVP